jgi:hypothetical protein
MRRIIWICAIAAVALMAGEASAQRTDCDRACLASVLDQYMNAVVANAPERAPLFVGFRQTENAIVTRPGTGVWRSVTALGRVQRKFYDDVSGQAAYFGSVEEGSESAIVTIRIRVERREVTEAEWYIGRRGDPGIDGPVTPAAPAGNLFDIDNLIANPPPERVVPRSERLSREALIAITNTYFDGITTHDGSIIMAHPNCLRVENGLKTTGRPLPSGSTDGYEGRTNCQSNMGTFSIALVAARRYPLVDLEAQAVLGTVVFLRDLGATRRRNGLSEIFYIDAGKIREIYAAMFYPAPEQPMPNWPPYDGNFPLPLISAPR